MDKANSVEVSKGRLVIGWTAVILSTIITSIWAFWGIIENFHEGWYHSSVLANLGLAFMQYLSPMLIFMGITLVILKWKRIGFGLHILLAIFAIVFFQAFSNAATFLLIIPFLGLGALHWFGDPQPRKRAYRITIFIPLLTLILSGIAPALRVSQRFNDNNLGARLVHGNGVDLIWAPEGPGWPLAGADWHEARAACLHLTDDGSSLSPTPQNIWRLPTVDEVVRSMTRHNENSGGVWNSLTAEATYNTQPDKESPLWNMYSQVIYWWTATEFDNDRAYIVVYDGGVWSRSKDFGPDYLGYRCIKSP